MEYTRNSFDYLIAIDNRLGKQDINVTFDSNICYGVGDSYVDAGKSINACNAPGSTLTVELMFN